MHFGLNPIGIYEKALPAELTWEERLNQAAEADYDFVEMSIDESAERLSRLTWTASERLALRRLIDKTGVPIFTLGLSCHRRFSLGSSSQQVREKGLDILFKAVNLARDLGIRIIQLMGYDVFYEPSNAGTKAHFLESLIQGAHWAGVKGVMLGLENVDVESINSVDKALPFVQKVNLPWLRLYPDVGNLVASGFNPIKQLGQPGQINPYLVGVHLKDTLPGQYRGVALEKGAVPFDDVFRLLAEMNFSGPLVMEMWAHLDESGDPVQTAADANQFIRHLIKANCRK